MHSNDHNIDSDNQDSSNMILSIANSVMNTATNLNLNQFDDISKVYKTVAIASTALIGTALLYYYNSNINQLGKSRRPNITDFNNQTREVKNEDGARINSISLTDKVIHHYYEDATTLYEIFIKARKLSNDGNYLGYKPSPNEPYKWLKYSEVAEIATNLGSGFAELGLEPAKETFIGVFLKNRPEWNITDTACHTYSFINVPLYDTLGQEAITFILLQTQLKLVVCDNSDKALQMMNTKSNLKYVIVVEAITEDAKHKSHETGIILLSFDQVQNLGKQKPKIPILPNKDDIATVCYTSGTTGTPKGAIITHGNVVSIASSMLIYVKNSGVLNEPEQERYISYLPLAHMFERICQATIVSLGGCIGFYQGDVKTLLDDIKEIKPTIFCTVPRLLNRIYSKINENIENSSPLKKAIFKWAFARKESEVMRGITRNNGIYDIPFKKIRESLGGKVTFIITGSAPLSPEILHFLRVVSGCFVLEGYGATETGGASGVQIPGETTVGNVGPPFLCSMYKLIDVPEMGIVTKRDNKGEVLVGGSNIFKGYYKDEEKTKEALVDGWFRTGDIGSFEKNGTLKIVDRVKNIFKLQQGEYIAPEKIESIYVRSKYVAQVFVYGNSYKSTLVSIIVPEQTAIFDWARDNNCEQDMESLCKNADLKKLILDNITRLGRDAGLKGFELAKDIYLHHELFSIENGLLTPTMKTKRIDMQKRFQSQIDEMYKNSD